MSAKEEILDKIIKAVDGKKNIKYTIGILDKDKSEHYLIGENGIEPFSTFHYEIGSITKIFTGLLVSRAVIQGLININDVISLYLEDLDDSKHLPTIKQILTHTSGFEYNPNEPDGEDYLPTGNPFLHVRKQEVIDEINRMQLENKKYPFCYSNIGAATIGLILEAVYKKTYHEILDSFINEIGLENTYSINPKYDLEGVRENGDTDGHWEWNANSTYNAAGCLVSTVKDMLKFGNLLMNSEEEYIQNAFVPLYRENTKDYTREIGYFILMLPKHNIYYHDGGTGCFNSLLSVDHKSQIVVCALSNSYMDIVNHTVSFTKQLAKEKQRNA